MPELETVLEGKEYQVSTTATTLNFTIEDSEIESIEITESKFIMVTNPDKWEKYL